MILPQNATLVPQLRFARGMGASRPVGSAGYKTVVIPAPAPPAIAATADEEQAIEPAVETPPVDPNAPTPAEVLISEEQAAEERKARKAALAREKRKRKNAAKKANNASTAGADGDSEDEAPAVAEAVVAVEAVLESASVDPTPLTPEDSASGSSDGKVSGASTPASSHGFVAVPRPLDWANDVSEDIPVPHFDESGRKSSASNHSRANDARNAYSEKLATDPSFTPRIGKFWGHDERLLENDLRGMSGWWRGRSSPAPGDRAASPAGTSDGGWQEVGKAQRQQQPRSGAVVPSWRLARDESANAVNAPNGPKPKAAPKSSWGKGNYAGQQSSGMRAWADDEEVEPAKSAHAAAAAGSIDASRPPEPPWTARSPVPYLFNSAGSRSYIDDESRKRMMVVRISLRPAKRGPAGRRPPEVPLTSQFKLPAQTRPRPLQNVEQPVRVSVGKGKQPAYVYHPTAERKRTEVETAQRAAQADREALAAEQQRVEAEQRAAKEAEEQVARETAEREAAEKAAAYNRERVEIEKRQLEAVRAAAQAAAAPLPHMVEQPVASTSTAPPPRSAVHTPASSSRPPSVAPPPFFLPPAPSHIPGLPPHMQAAYMFPSGPFTFDERFSVAGVHVFEPALGYIIPYNPDAPALPGPFYPPPPGMPLGMPPPPPPPAHVEGPASPMDYMSVPLAPTHLPAQAQPPPSQQQQASTGPSPAFFSPARSSKVQIRAPSPGHIISPRSVRRHPQAMQHTAPPISRDQSLPLEEAKPAIVPGSYISNGITFFDAAPPPPPPSFYPPPPQAFHGGSLPSMQQGGSAGPTADFVDPAILSMTPGIEMGGRQAQAQAV